MSREACPVDTRSAIIEAGIRLISERGFERVSTRDIAAKVGIASPSLYKHFASLGDITAEALKLVTERRAETYRQVLSEQLVPCEALKKIAVTMISGFLENPTLIRLYQQVLTPQAGRAIEVIDPLWDSDLIPTFLSLIKDVDPEGDESFAYFVLFSFALGAAMYLPTQERRRPLSKLKRTPLLLAERGLTAALPRIDWPRIAPQSAATMRPGKTGCRRRRAPVR